MEKKLHGKGTMALLTDQFWTELNDRHPNFTIKKATLSYVNSLLLPYEVGLRQQPTITDVNQWIGTYMPADLPADPYKADAYKKVFEFQDKRRAGLIVPNMTETDVYVTEFIQRLARTIFSQAEFYAGAFSNSVIITPWDILSAIAETSYWRQMFPRYDRSLPVQVTINGQTFEHSLTEAFVYGLLDFYQAANQQPPILSLYGEKFDRKYVLNNEEQIDNRHDANDDEAGWKYLVKVGAHSKGFYRLDYLQGLLTAAQWLNMDVHALVRDLEGLNEKTGVYEPLTF